VRRRLPSLNRGFESSLADLDFLGAPSAWNYGPLMRFAAGTEFRRVDFDECRPPGNR
jgi:hypothetical protein